MKVELFQYEIFEPPVKFPYNKAMNAWLQRMLYGDSN